MKMEYKVDERRWKAVGDFLDKVIEDPDRYPDKGVILALEDEEMTKLFTKKRVELIRIIKSKKIDSMSQLAKITKRELSAVERDLKILEKFGVVELKKTGKIVKPIIEADAIVLPLRGIEPEVIVK